MQATAIQRYVRITPRKCNQVLALIRGQAVEQAQTTLQFTPKNGARIVQKVLKSAVANALHEGNSTGMGLGLSFVVAILEHHNAALEIESEPLKGATFRARFPPG